MDKFEVAQREGFLLNILTEVRDRLRPIVSGEIKRGHCVGNRECYGGKPGNRKTTLADARSIAKHAVAYIDQSIARHDKESR